MSTRDIQDTLHELYGVKRSAQSISTITDKIWSLVEAYHRQIRRVTKTKPSFPSPEAAHKLLYLATVDIKRK